MEQSHICKQAAQLFKMRLHLIQLTYSDSMYQTILIAKNEWVCEGEEKGKKRKTWIIICTFLAKTKPLLIHCDSDISKTSDAHFLWKFKW